MNKLTSCAAVFVAFIVLLALAMSQAGGQPADRPSEVPIELKGSDAPLEFTATPGVAMPGTLLRFLVTNRSGRIVTFGLGGVLQERRDGRWAKVAGVGQSVLDILLITEPGETTGPRYSNGDVFDGFRIPTDLSAGTYRWKRSFEVGDDRLIATARFVLGERE